MIKSVGFGRRLKGTTHEECVQYHREIFSPLGKRLIGHRGLEKYVAYYADRAYSLAGVNLPEPPWDMAVVESYTEEFWQQMETWRRTHPDGQQVTEQMTRFLDLSSGLMMLCEENEIIRPRGEGGGVALVWLGVKKEGISHEEFIKYHREVHVPLALSMLGDGMQGYVAYYVNAVLSLAEGFLSSFPYDAMVITRCDEHALAGMEEWRKTPEGRQITEDEERFMDREKTIALVCRENIIIP
jgi:hypothetical protein